MKRRLVILVIFILIGMGVFTTIATPNDAPTRMTIDELKAMLDSPDLIIIDVRVDKHWNASDMKIKGAIREDGNDVKSWAGKYSKDKLLVVYCA
jgi:rhodanese-related sulfurtransferase